MTTTWWDSRCVHPDDTKKISKTKEKNALNNDERVCGHVLTATATLHPGMVYEKASSSR
jgi:hypothetical protein